MTHAAQGLANDRIAVKFSEQGGSFKHMVSRRAFLSGVFASFGTAAQAFAPETSIRPVLRPGGISQRGLPDAADLIAQANLGGRVGFAVADAQSGQMVETFFPLFALPPASVTKVLTGAYALDRLGRDFRFRTRFAALGAVNNGHLRGDLWLIGAGDPLFDTDALVRMVQNLRDGGIRTITGRLMIAHGALPQFFEIDSSQPDHVGYNPAISGLNLNFNRVHFEWRRTSSDYFVTMDARSDTIRPTVDMAQMHIANRVLPVYTYDQQGDQDHWTVARDALGEGGARWLPVVLRCRGLDMPQQRRWIA